MALRSPFWRQTWVRAVLLVMTLGVMTMIFVFSAQDGETTMQTSGPLTEAVLRLASPDYETLPPVNQNAVYVTVRYFVRKAGHFSEYALLGLCLRLLLHTFSFGYPTFWAWLGATLYAGTDELHQLLTGSRTGMWQDVVLDSMGALTGVAFGCLLALLIDRKIWGGKTA